jgi:Dna[CI] antecedent, DciA
LHQQLSAKDCGVATKGVNSTCKPLHQLKYLYHNQVFFMGEYSMQDAMKKFLKQSRLNGYVQALQIEDVWAAIMGKTISKYTEKIQIHGSKLYITTSVGPLKNELQFQKESIIKRVNEALGEEVIKEVIIN